MKKIIKIIREYRPTYTKGNLYINDKLICHTRECPRYGKLPYKCIPEGEYTVDMTCPSPRFGKSPWAQRTNGKVPLIVGKHGRTGIRIHVGNYASGDSISESQGCILVGQSVGDRQSMIYSIDAYNKLIDNLMDNDKYILVITSNT